MGEKAVFLDKDGTLIEDVPYNVDPSRIRLMHGALSGLELLHRLAYKLVVITNQSGVARGLFKEEDLKGVEARLRSLFRRSGLPLAGFYYCPHHPDGAVPAYTTDCCCRKPSPGLLHRAALDLDVDLKASWVVGDILDDVEAGTRGGCRTVLINNGNETEWILTRPRRPDLIASDLFEAARLIRMEEQLTGSLS